MNYIYATKGSVGQDSRGPIKTQRPRSEPFIRNTLFQYGLQITKYLFPFITIPYLTRTLGPDIYAVRAYILAAMTFAQVLLDYGFNNYGTRQIARHQGNMEVVRAETYTIVVLRLLLCVFGAFAVAVIIPFIPLMAANPMYVAIAYLCVCFKATLPDFVFQGLEDMAIITYRFISSQVVATILIFFVVHGPEDLLWVPVLESLAALIALVWSWANVVKTRAIKPILPHRTMLISAFRTSSIFFLSSAATTVFTSLTTLAIGMLVKDTAQIAYWSVAMTAIQAIQSLYTPITNSLYPRMCAQRDFSLVKRLLFIGMPIVIVGTIVFARLSNAVMLVLGGEEYLPGSYIVAMVSPVLLFSFPGMLLGFPVLAAVGWDKQLTSTAVIASVFHVAGLVLLAVVNAFTIPNVCILRCCTEGVLLFMRAFFVMRWRKVARREDATN